MQCDYFDVGQCRSCTLMGTAYDLQLADKQSVCRAALAEVAPHLAWLEPCPSRESHFRNKAKLVVGGRAGRVTLGILDAHGTGTDLRGCGLHEPGLRDAIDVLAGVCDDLGLVPYDVPGRRGELKYVIATHSPDGELMVRFVLRSRRHVEAIRAALPVLHERIPGLRVVSVNLHPEHRAVLEGDTEIVLTATDSLTMRLGAVRLHLRPLSFFQTNTDVAAALYRQAAAWIDETSPAVLLDLYCGVGGFALHAVAPGRAVHGVEVSDDAVGSARLSAAEAGADATFDVADATTVDSLRPAGLVVVNPPRRGIGPELAGWLEASPATGVVYSSCNVTSLARDLALLPSFTARSARVFDMFPQTRHQEVLVRLAR